MRFFWFTLLAASIYGTGHTRRTPRYGVSGNNQKILLNHVGKAGGKSLTKKSIIISSISWYPTTLSDACCI